MAGIMRGHTLWSRAIGLSLAVGASATFVFYPAWTSLDADTRHSYSKEEIGRALGFYAKRNRLDPALLRAVIKAESDFRHDAVSRKGAVGLMQLTPAAAASLQVTDRYDPIQNIRGGSKHLRYLLDRYEGNLALALAAYNAGVHRVKGSSVPQIGETRAYVKKVMKYYYRYAASASTARHQA